MSDVDRMMLNAGGNLGVQRFLKSEVAEALYASRLPIGPRGGAMIDFGRAVVLECFAPFRDEMGELPFVPMPFDGATLLHDIGRKKHVEAWELDACMRGVCQCDDYPTGWVLPRAAVRALLGVGDSFLNDVGRQLPGLIGSSWSLKFDTLTFMRACYFDPEFVLPTRGESRAARADRTSARASIGWKHLHPERTRRDRHR